MADDINTPSPADSALEAALRDEAARERPPFSQTLHGRVMAAVDAARQSAASAPVVDPASHSAAPTLVSKRARLLWPSAAAVAALIAVAVGLHSVNTEQHKPALPQLPVTPAVAEAPDPEALQKIVAFVITAARQKPVRTLNSALNAGPAELHARVVRLARDADAASRGMVTEATERENTTPKPWSALRKPFAVERKRTAPFFDVRFGLLSAPPDD